MTEKKAMQVAKAIRVVTAVVGVGGFLLTLGAVGSCENFEMSLWDCTKYSTIGLTMMGLAVHVSNKYF